MKWNHSKDLEVKHLKCQNKRHPSRYIGLYCKWIKIKLVPKTDNLRNFSKYDIFENFVNYDRFIVDWSLF